MLLAIRIGLPIALAVAGLVVALLGAEWLGLTLAVIAVLTWLANLYVRLALSSQRDREEEAERRREYERTGRWGAGA